MIDYSINKKNPDAIVYIDADGCHFNLTVNDFASEEEFRRWKQWSDENYREQRNEEAQYEKHTLPESALTDETIQIPSAEDEIMRCEELKECSALIEEIRQRLTPKQFRRLVMHYVEGMTQEELAKIEGISQQGISDMLRRSKHQASKIISEVFLKKYL